MNQVHIFIAGYARRNNGEAGVGICFKNDKDSEPFYEEAGHIGVETQNTAVYQAIKRALEKAKGWNIQDVSLYTDNRLVAAQLNKSMGARTDALKPVYNIVSGLADTLENFTVNYVPPPANQKARTLAKAASFANPELYTEQAIRWDVGPGITGVVLSFSPKLMIVKFVYKKGSSIPTHHHYHEQGSYILAGSLKYKLADKEVVAIRGTSLVIVSNTEHSVQAMEDTVEIATYAPMRADFLKFN